ncbi:MAG: aminopeptidase P family protein, partial [Alicyclobacillus sp.]|nr:aminopeptidase P family protein [Alicyclobacillus sp.]
GLTSELRARKSADELAIIRKAARIADAAFDHILGYLRPGLTELEVALELEVFMRKQGATGAAFTTIVASGVRSALPHGTATEKPLEHGDLVTFDFGAVVDGYVSDLTRTVVLGKPSAEQQRVYQIVLEAQERALAALNAGCTGRDMDSVARSFIADQGYGDAFGHSLGHGIGLEIHEAPRLSKTSTDLLEAGMVVTVEPGIYLPGWGGVRIEDDVVIEAGRIQLLTHAPKAHLLAV